MKSLVKALARKILFRNFSPRKFMVSRLSTTDIVERVFFVNGSQETDITWEHCIVCHEPFQMAVWTTPVHHNLLTAGPARVEVRKNNQAVAEVAVEPKRSLELDGNTIVVYEITKARCRQLGYWQQYILLKRYFLYKKKDTFLQGMIYGAMYSFPRRVIVVSYNDNDYFNIFPMDFQCIIERANLVLLGLRTTNTTLKKILTSGKVVISDTSSASLETIYALGRNHSAAPPSADQLPFGVIRSEQLGFYVPNFSASYREFEIVRSFELGTHTMIIGSLLNAKKLYDGNSFIHHVHFFEFVASGYNELT